MSKESDRKFSIREIRQRLRQILQFVESGQEVVILRRGKEVAKIVPVARKKSRKTLPSLKDFRSSIKIKGIPLSAEVIRERRTADF